MMFVQCDHREPAEIAAREALSTLLAVMRVLIARQRDASALVEYAFEHEPPGFVADAIATAVACPA